MDTDPGSLPHDLWPRSVPPNRWFWISHCIQLYNKIKTCHLFSPMRTAHLSPKTLATLLPGYATYQLSLRAFETWTALCYNAQYTCFCMSVLLRTVGIRAQWVPLKARWADLRIQTLFSTKGNKRRGQRSCGTDHVWAADRFVGLYHNTYIFIWSKVKCDIIRVKRNKIVGVGSSDDKWQCHTSCLH